MNATRNALLGASACCLLVACAMPPWPSVVSPKTVAPSAFAYPGIYSGSVVNGVITYALNRDGTGRSCFRNSFSGRMFFGDVTYDGRALYTEDGIFQVDAVSPEALQLSAPSLTANLSRITDPPTVCADFFRKVY